MLFVKRLLQAPSKTYYTLNLVFTPLDAQSATCILTYDGQAHSATSATVEVGTVITYSINSTKYGVASGTVTMNADTTLTCTGTTTTVYNYYKRNILEYGSTALIKNNSIISGFTSGNATTAVRATSPNYYNVASASSIEFQVKFIIPAGSVPTTQTVITGGTAETIPGGSKGQDFLGLRYRSRVLQFGLHDFRQLINLTTLPTSLSSDTTYTAKLTYSSSGTLWTSYLNGTVENTLSYAISNIYPDYINIGTVSTSAGEYQYPFTGSVDLADCYLKVNGSFVWQGVVAGTSSNYDYYTTSESYSWVIT